MQQNNLKRLNFCHIHTRLIQIQWLTLHPFHKAPSHELSFLQITLPTNHPSQERVMAYSPKTIDSLELNVQTMYPSESADKSLPLISPVSILVERKVWHWQWYAKLVAISDTFILLSFSVCEIYLKVHYNSGVVAMVTGPLLRPSWGGKCLAAVW